MGQEVQNIPYLQAFTTNGFGDLAPFYTNRSIKKDVLEVIEHNETLFYKRLQERLDGKKGLFGSADSIMWGTFLEKMKKKFPPSSSKLPVLLAISQPSLLYF